MLTTVIGCGALSAGLITAQSTVTPRSPAYRPESVYRATSTHPRSLLR